MEIRQSSSWVIIRINRIMISNNKSRSNSNQKILMEHQKSQSNNKRISNNTNSHDGMMCSFSRLLNASLTSKMIASMSAIIHNK